MANKFIVLEDKPNQDPLRTDLPHFSAMAPWREESTSQAQATKPAELDDVRTIQVENLAATFDLDDPHRAAQEDNPEKPERLSRTTIGAIFVRSEYVDLCLHATILTSSKFLGLSTVAPITIGVLVVPSILVNIGEALGDTTDVSWIPGGWAISSSVSFCVAGRLSDIFGRRYIIMLGQFLAIIGAVSDHANSFIGSNY